MTLHAEDLDKLLERERNQAEEIGTFPLVQSNQDIFSLSKKYDICPTAFAGCYGTRDIEIFERACSKNFKYCLNFQKNKLITKEEYESKACVVEFSERGRQVALVGGLI